MSEEFRHNPEASRFEAWIDGRHVGSAEYTLRGNVASFHHTNVDAALNGHLPVVKISALRFDPFQLGTAALLSELERRFPEPMTGVRAYLERTAPAYG